MSVTVRHIRRMRALYAARGQALAEAVRRHLAGGLSLQKPAVGMHTIGWIEGPGMDRDKAARAAALGVEARPLSLYRIRDRQKASQGLVLGYGAVPEERIAAAVRRLGAALASRG